MLEIGKYYQQRNGVVVGPLREYTGRLADSFGFKFCCDVEGISDRAWRVDGSFSLLENDKHSCDIVSGVQFTPLQDLTVQLTQQPKEEIVSKLKIEAGKFYKDRGGDVHGPMLSADNENYPFVDQDCLTYTLYGKYVEGVVSGADLIEEVPDPYEIKPEEIGKIDDSHNRPTIEEVLSAIQRGDIVTAEDEDGNRYNIYSNNPIRLLIDAKTFTIKAKQPVVKYKYAFQEKDSPKIIISDDYYVDADDFLDGDSKNDFVFFEPIVATRKEF